MLMGGMEGTASSSGGAALEVARQRCSGTVMPRVLEARHGAVLASPAARVAAAACIHEAVSEMMLMM